MKKLFTYFAFVWMGFLTVTAQNQADKIAQPTSGEQDHKNIPPLTILIDSAMNHSPILDAKYAEAQQLMLDLKMEKKSWTEFIYLEASGRYGLFNQITIKDQNTGPSDVVGLKSENEQINYYAGLSIKLPISALSNRRNETRIKQYMIEQSGYEAQQIKKDLTQLVIEEYYKLKTYQESMKALQDAVQTLEISYLKVMKDLEKGNVEIDEFALLVSTRGKAKDAWLKAKNDFYMQHIKLQVITGVKF